MEVESDTSKDPSLRERIWEKYDKKQESEAATEAEPVQAEEIQPQQEQPSQEAESPEGSEQEHPEGEEQPKPSRLYANKYKTPEELEAAYAEAEKKMHSESQKRSDTEKEFAKIKNYIDWNRLQSDISGQPYQPIKPPQVPNIPVPEFTMDKEKFFQELAEKGPKVIDERANQIAQNQLKQIFPHLVQNVVYQSKVYDAYQTFKEDNPDLLQFEETIGQKTREYIEKNPNWSPTKAMKEAVKSFRDYLNTLREEGKREAQVIHEEKKQDNIPSGSKNKPRIPTPPPEEEKPESLADIINARKANQEKTRSQVGVKYQRR